jgi:wyosine [tRNA(Phe)-imidazoG37] synthetase (radical SAM superfamily)
MSVISLSPPDRDARRKSEDVMGLVVEQHHQDPLESAGKRVGHGVLPTRETLGNRFVYLVVSPRARGLAVGVNFNPDRRCNFECLYCDVDRRTPPGQTEVDVDVLADELASTLSQVQQGQLRRLDAFRNLPDELLALRHVAISGDGEPTLCPVFADALRAVVHVRARGQFPFFKIVLLTNGTTFDQPAVQHGLRLLIPQDEVWAKLDAGTNTYFKRVNRPHTTLAKVLSNILLLARQRPVVIQSLFPLLDGQEPPEDEIDQYAHRLLELVAGGAQIPLVQIYSATRAPAHPECGHLPLRVLSRIAHKVRAATNLPVEVF